VFLKFLEVLSRVLYFL